MAEKKLVLGIFADEVAADAAVATLQEWDKASAEVKLGAIGVLVVDDKGQIKEHKLGQRSTKKGAGIGLVLAVIAPPTLLVGLVGGKAAVGVLAPSGEATLISDKLTELGGTPEVHDVTDEALAEVAAAAPAETEAPATEA